MIKKSLMLLIFIFMAAGVSAVSVSMTELNSTIARVSVADALELYAYEVNLIYTGEDTLTSSNADFYDYLAGEGDSTTTGVNQRGSQVSVYESILSASSLGVNGSGDLFNLTHSGSLSLNTSVLVFVNGTETTINHVTGQTTSVSSSSGGGGGGGGGLGGGLDPFSTEDALVHIETFPGERSTKNVVIENNGPGEIVITDIQIEGLEDVLTINEQELTLSSRGSEDIRLVFDIPVDYEPDVYTGRILLVSSEFTGIINVVLEVHGVDGALFDVVINFPAGSEFTVGEDIVAEIEVDNFGDLRGFDFFLFYAIKDFEGRTLAFAEENIAIETKVELIRELTVPGDALPGDYIFTAKASYEDAVASGSKTFSVTQVSLSPFTGNVFLIVLGVAVAIIAIVTVVVVLSVRGRRKVKGRR